MNKLKGDIMDLCDELERIQLPYLVTDKLHKLMEKHKIKRNRQPRGVSAG